MLDSREAMLTRNREARAARKEIGVQPREVRKAAKDVRRSVAKALALLDAGLLHEAYRAAEAAQHAAFDMKDLIASGGKYEPPVDDVVAAGTQALA